MKTNPKAKDTTQVEIGRANGTKGLFHRWLQMLRPTPLGAIAIAGGVGVHLLGFSIFQVIPETDTQEYNPRAMAKFTDLTEGSANRVFREQAIFFDSAPLFIPTPWNYSSTIESQILSREKEQLFSAYAESITLADRVLQPYRGVYLSKVKKPLDILKGQHWDFSPVYASAAGEQAPVRRTSGQVKIVELSSGQTVTSTNLPPELAEITDLHFQPVQFLLTIDSIGPVGEPLMLRGSGEERIDQSLRQYLSGPFITSRLGAGYYKIVIGP